MSLIWPPLVMGEAEAHSDNLYNVSLPALGDGFVLSQPMFGSATFDGLVGEPELELEGVLWPGANYAFYNRIIIIPPELNLGNVLSTQVRSLLIWNGFLEPKTLEDIEEDGATGMILAGRAPVSDYLPLEMIHYTLTVAAAGPTVIAASYTFTIDGIEYVVEVTGNRAIVFPFEPNYRQPIVEKLTWRTDVITAYSGAEQRRAIRTKARRDFGYNILLTGNQLQKFQNSMLGWQNRSFAIPVWTDKKFTTTVLDAGDTSIPITVAGYSFTAGENLILMRSATEYEVAEIESIGATIELTNPLVNSWPVHTLVMPVIQGHLPENVDAVRPNDNVLASPVSFISSPEVTDPFTPTAAAAVTYEGLEVITEQPNWRGGRNTRYNYDFDQVDAGTGAINWFDSDSFGRIIIPYGWLLKSRAEILDFREFLGRRVGRQKALWVPSWTQDFIITDDVGAADTFIQVRENDFRQLVNVNPVYNQIMIRTNSGQIFYRHIESVISVPGGTDMRLVLDEVLGADYLISDFRPVQFLFKCRLANDEVELSWRNDKTVVVETNFITVKE
jgi:hypothetical protein